jgi:hypothetical protein
LWFNAAMSNDEAFTTNYTHMPGVDYTFASLGRNLTGEECETLTKKYFEEHNRMTLPGETLFVDLRPAFRKPFRWNNTQTSRVHEEEVKQYRIDVASVLSPFLVDFCEPQPDDLPLQNEIAFCSRRTNVRLYPSLVLPVG